MAVRFENLVASHLLKAVQWYKHVYGEKLELRYYRDVVGHEVDFILLRDSQPWIAIEVKVAEQDLDPNLKYLIQRVKIPHVFQISLDGKNDWSPGKINASRVRILPASRFLMNLP